MTNYRTPLVSRSINNLPTGAGIVAFLVGIFVIIGWMFDVTFFTSLHPSLVAVKPNTAVAFILSGLSLVLLGQREKRPSIKPLVKLSPILISAVIALGLITLLQYLLARDLGIDQIFFREPIGAVETFVPGRMSPLAAGSFLLLGISHLFAYRYRYWASQFLSLTVIVLGIAALFGYGFQVEALYSLGPYTSVALHAAVSFLLLGAGTIALFPQESIIRIISRNDVGGLVARRLLPAALIIPLVLGLVILAGQRMGFYESNVTVLLITVSTVIVFTFIIFTSARLLSLIERERRETEHIGRHGIESAQERLRFLAKASRILARSLDYRVTLDRIARLSVPFISDWCAIDIITNGDLKRVTIKHIDESKSKIVEELAQKYPSNPNSERGIYSVIVSGKSELFYDLPDAMLREAAQDEEHLQLMRSLDIHSLMVIPLKGREAKFGAITFATAESKRVFTEEDLELAEELGRRAAMAIENAQLYQESKIQKEELEVRVRRRTNELEVANLELRTEIQERKRIESELRESEETLASLVRTASKLITLLDVNKVYEIICEETARALDVPICNIRLFDKRTNQLRFTSGFGLPDDFWNRIVSPSNQYHDFLSRGRDHQTNITADVQTLTESPNYELFRQYNIRTTVGVSLMLEDQLLGRLTIATTGESRDFSEYDLALLKGLADQAALAIQNAQLLGQVQAGRERLRRLNRKLVFVQEDERRRISRELHDEAGQALTAMKINLSLLKNILPDGTEEIKEQLADLSELADEIMERLRRLAHDLRPPALETLGLNKSLEGLCRQFANRTKIPVKYDGIENIALPEEATITIYRLVQEGLTNIAKHSQADHAKVKLEEQDKSIIVTIKDNGQGFTVEDLDDYKTPFDGLGLNGMRERLEFMNGQLEIISKTGWGTEITAAIPLEEI